MKLPRKKRVEEIDKSLLVEPRLSEEEWDLYLCGVSLFNKHKFWEAHEVWEEVWKRRAEESRIFFQGIIQAAAAYHRTVTEPRFIGSMNNFGKALQKLELFPERFLGLDVKKLRGALENSRNAVKRLGKEGLRQFPAESIPKVEVHRTTVP